MKNYIKILVVIFATALVTTGCSPLMYAQDDTTTNPQAYNYDNGYGDPPPPDQSGAYDYNSQDPNAKYDQSQPYDDADASNAPQITYNDFNTQLSPYGQWSTDPNYGQVWYPNVSGFQPYSTNGYWTYTNYGWTWVSSYAWGWAPFHYGRWGYGGRGWFWIPGYTWGPAWVAWSSGASMYGWAPLGPGMRLGVSISIGAIPSSYWTFMPSQYMGYNNIGNYYVNRSRNVTIIKNTTIINNYGNFGKNNNRRYSMGPNINDVEKTTGRKFTAQRVVSTNNVRNTGVSNNEVRMYRPTVNTNRNTTTTNRTTNPRTKTTKPTTNTNVNLRTNTNTNNTTTPTRTYGRNNNNNLIQQQSGTTQPQQNQSRNYQQRTRTTTPVQQSTQTTTPKVQRTSTPRSTTTAPTQAARQYSQIEKNYTPTRSVSQPRTQTAPVQRMAPVQRSAPPARSAPVRNGGRR